MAKMMTKDRLSVDNASNFELPKAGAADYTAPEMLEDDNYGC
jgi:hypothetical protein